MYVAAVKGGGRVDDKTLAATADMVAAATRLEELNPTLRMMVHMSGVDGAGAVTFASIYGTDRAVDSDVLRVMSQVHQFVRGRDSLRGVTLPVGGRPAQLVDDDSQGFGTLPPGMTLRDYVDLMTSAADDLLPPPLSIQRMARRLSRTAAGLSPVGPSSESDSSGSEKLPGTAFTLEAAERPSPHNPSEQAFNFVNSLLYINSATGTLLRAVLKAAICHLVTRAGTLPRYVTECLARWWPHKLPTAVVPDDGIPGERWPVEVLVDNRLLTTTRRTRDNRAVGSSTVTLDAIPTNNSACPQDCAVASILLLWDKEPSARTPMRQCRFRAEVVQIGQSRLSALSAAAVGTSPNTSTAPAPAPPNTGTAAVTAVNTGTAAVTALNTGTAAAGVSNTGTAAAGVPNTGTAAAGVSDTGTEATTGATAAARVAAVPAAGSPSVLVAPAAPACIVVAAAPSAAHAVAIAPRPSTVEPQASGGASTPAGMSAALAARAAARASAASVVYTPKPRASRARGKRAAEPVPGKGPKRARRAAAASSAP